MFRLWRRFMACEGEASRREDRSIKIVLVFIVTNTRPAFLRGFFIHYQPYKYEGFFIPRTIHNSPNYLADLMRI